MFIHVMGAGGGGGEDRLSSGYKVMLPLKFCKKTKLSFLTNNIHHGN